MKKRFIGLLALLAFSFIGFFIPASAVTQPVIVASKGSATQSVGFISIPLSVTATHAIIVFEWIGPLLVSPCSFILTPSDAFSNAFSAIGNCLSDTNGDGMRAFSVSSSSQTGTDAISCNFGSPNTQVEACYVFDVSNPGAITLLASASGNSASPSVGSSAAASNALELVTAGLEPFCQSVVSGDIGFTQYIPTSACNSGGGSISQYGEAGGYEQIGPGGLTSTFPLFTGQTNVWIELVVQVAPAASTSTTTTFTATITGWLVPDTTHLGNTIIFILLSLGGMCVGVLPFTFFYKDQEIGDRAIYPGLIGMLLGSTLGDLTVTSQTAPAIPFADLIVSGLLLFLWWWNS